MSRTCFSCSSFRALRVSLVSARIRDAPAALAGVRDALTSLRDARPRCQISATRRNCADWESRRRGEQELLASDPRVEAACAPAAEQRLQRGEGAGALSRTRPT